MPKPGSLRRGNAGGRIIPLDSLPGMCYCLDQLMKACLSDDKSNSIEVASQANEECRWHHEPHAVGVRHPWQEGNPLGGRAIQGKISFPPSCNNNLIPLVQGQIIFKDDFPTTPPKVCSICLKNQFPKVKITGQVCAPSLPPQCLPKRHGMATFLRKF